MAVVFILFLSCHCKIMYKEGCERERELHVMVTRLSTADGLKMEYISWVYKVNQLSSFFFLKNEIFEF